MGNWSDHDDWGDGSRELNEWIVAGGIVVIIILTFIFIKLFEL
jgi:hypothetical protein